MFSLHSLRIITYILLWYFFSTTLSLYNKHLVGQSNYGLPYPLLTSAVHAGMQFLLSALFLFACSSKTVYQNIETETQKAERDRQRWAVFFYGILPCGIATGLDIGLSNASLATLTLTTYTLCKSTVPLWCLFFAILLGLETPQWRHFVIMTLVVIGAVLTVQGETEFHATGFSLVLLASLSSGFRWALTQRVLQRQIHSPLMTLYQQSPISCVLLLCMSFYSERPMTSLGGLSNISVSSSTITTTSGNSTTPTVPLTTFNSSQHTLLNVLGRMAVGGGLAFCMLLSELVLVQSTSVLTLSLAGTFKEIVVLFSAMLVYGDVMTQLQWVGVGLTMCAVVWYNQLKNRHSDGHQESKSHNKQAEI